MSDMPFRSGFVAVVGKPNTGKSTLMNGLLGEKLAIVSPRPQTTRIRQLGILTLDHAQIIFVDTPGVHNARNRLDDFMFEVAQKSASDADVVLFLLDASSDFSEEDRAIAESLGQIRGQVILVINKVDLIDDGSTSSVATAASRLLPNRPIIEISALQMAGLDALLDQVVSVLPEGPQYFPEDQLTDMFVRDNVAEIIREQALTLFDDEIPHAIAVEINEFKERSDNLIYISATIYVEKESQKGIVIGQKGMALRTLGKQARGEIEPILGAKVYLDLWVKVLNNWRKDPQALRRLGYVHKE